MRLHGLPIVLTLLSFCLQTVCAQPVTVGPDGALRATIPTAVTLKDAPALPQVSVREAVFRTGEDLKTLTPRSVEVIDERTKRIPLIAVVTLNMSGTYEVAVEEHRQRTVAADASVKFLSMASSPLESISVPDQVLAQPDGHSVVKMRIVGPLSKDAALRWREMTPAEVPVYTQNADGSISPGFFLQNTATRAVGAIGGNCPVAIRRLGPNTYEIITMHANVARLGDGVPALFQPGERSAVPVVDRARVIENEGTPHSLRGPPGWLLRPIINPALLTPEELEMVRGAADVVSEIWIQLLTNNTGFVTFDLQFSNDVPMDALAETAVFTGGTRGYFETSSNLLLFHGIDNESIAEQGVYFNLPPGNSIATEQVSNQPFLNVTDIRVPIAIDQKWGFPSTGFPVFRISFRRSAAFYYNGAIPRAQAGAKADFSKSLAHEIGHGLGFTSGLDRIPTETWIWDLFRFSEARVGGNGVDATEFRTLPRCLIQGQDAVGATRLGAGNSFALSSGAGPQASHWRPQLDGSCIGLFHPYEDTDCPSVDGYFTAADKAAMDIIGWNIDIGGEPLPPLPVIPDLPNNMAMVSATPNLSWIPGGGAFGFVVVISTIGPQGDLFRYASELLDSASTSFVVPTGVLLAGARYHWSVTAQNFSGYAYSEIREFQVAGTCTADFNGDGAVSVQDLFDFLAAFFEPLPSADVNGNGQVTVDDLFFFLQAWFGGC